MEIEAMPSEIFPFRDDPRRRFPNMREIFGFEGGIVYAAEQSGKFYLIVDEGTMADFLGPDDQDLVEMLVQVIEFDDEGKRQQYMTKKGWNRNK